MIEYDPRVFKLPLVVMTLLFTPFFLFIDSPHFVKHVFDGRILANGIVIVMYILFLTISDRKLFKLLLIMPFVGLFFEILGAEVFTAYQYRLDHIPLYIPLGHALLYGLTYEISRLDYIWSNRKALESFLHKFCFTISFTSLLVNNDVMGFLIYLQFLVLLRNRKKPLFYLLMFVSVFFMDLCGTTMYTWTYYGILGNHPSWPSIGVVPAGVAGIYMILDMSANSIYYYLAHYRHTRAMLDIEKKKSIKALNHAI